MLEEIIISSLVGERRFINISKFPGVVNRIFTIFCTMFLLVINLGRLQKLKILSVLVYDYILQVLFEVLSLLLTILESTYKLLCTVNFTIVKYISKPNIMMFKKGQRTIIFDKQFLHDLKMS